MVILEIRPMVGLCRDSANRLLPVFSNKILYIPLNLCSLISREEYMEICAEKNRFNYNINVDVIVVDQKDPKDGSKTAQNANDNNNENNTGENLTNNKKDKMGIKLLNAKLIDNNKKHYKVVGRYADLSV